MFIKSSISKLSISILLSIIIFFFFLYCSSPLFPFLHHFHETTNQVKELREVLREASMETRTVIVTMIDNNTRADSDIRHGSQSVVDSFLGMLRGGEATKHLVNHLVILTLDPRTFGYCKSVHRHCFFKHSRTRELGKHTQRLLERNEFLLQVVELGYNLFYTDVNLIWWKNPLPMFGSDDHVSVGCEFEKTGREYIYLKSGARSIHLFKMWKLFHLIYPHQAHSSLCELRSHWDFGPIINSTITFIPSSMSLS
ncbi:Uncharacterized protein At1g28695 [Linum perenne]